ncbi:MAG: hypothetical protein KatS3mg104_0776 [Phycisphaerae bacterium]|nr:MAG: hypothetical protein KatS3mg104_0776 [Phycisphaerae bacterium]
MAGMSDLSSRVRIQPRDLELLSGLLELRVMTLAQVRNIHFAGKHAAARRRIRLLKDAGIVRELPRHRFETSVLTLTPHAIRLLRHKGRLAQFVMHTDRWILRRTIVSHRLLCHELMVSESKAMLHQAERRDGHFSVESFHAWPGHTRISAQVRRRGGLAVRWIDIRPDAIATLRFTGEPPTTVFIEADRSTETWAVLRDKVDAYHELFRSQTIMRFRGPLLLMVFSSRRRACRCTRWLAIRSRNATQGTIPVVVVHAGLVVRSK